MLCPPGALQDKSILFVDFLAMSNARDIHNCFGVVDNVYHPPVTYADAPLVLITPKFLHPFGLGSSASTSIFFTIRASTASGSISSSFRAEGFISTE
jgi:hypothetical protein